MKYNVSNLNTKTNLYVMNNGAIGSGISFAGITLDPAPFVSIAVEKYVAGDYTIGGLLVVTLNGVMHGDGFSSTADQLVARINALGSNNECLNDIHIGCGDTDIISSGFGWIRNYSFPEGDQKNWYNIIPYTIELAVIKDQDKQLVIPDSNLPGNFDLTDKYIKSIKSNISYTIDDKVWQTFSPTGNANISDNHIYSNEFASVKYNLEVQGIGVCNCNNSGILGGIEAAYSILRDYSLLDTISIDCPSEQLSGTVPTDHYDFATKFNHTRNVQVNEIEGSISIDGEYIVRPSGVNKHILLTMDSNADASIETGEKNITLNGTIRGLANVSYTDLMTPNNNNASINNAAMGNAESSLTSLLADGTGILQYINDKNNLLSFVQHIGDNLKPLGYGDTEDGMTNSDNFAGSDSVEFRLMQKVFKRNHHEASIDFTLTFSNKNRHKIPNALWADINIEHELPSRRLAEHVVPGRGYPLLQDILCDTLDSYTITINAQFEPTQNVHKIIAAAREHVLLLINKTAEDLQAGNWVRTQDNESIGNNGSYRRTIKLTRHSCFSSSALKYSQMAPPDFLDIDAFIPAEPME